MGGPGIYSICFSQLDCGKDSFPLDEVFSAFIAIRLLRDNEGAVIEDYPTSLIGEIRFDLQDKMLLGIILLLLLVRFSFIYRTWTFHMTLIFFFSSILLSYYVYIFNNYTIISGFTTNEINENKIFNVIKMMTLVMSVMFLKQKHIKINDTQISVIVKLLY